MGRPPKYSDDQRIEALEIYRTEGPTVAAERTGISKSMITRWAKALGYKTEVITRTLDASEAVAAQRALKREQVREAILDTMIEARARMGQPHTDFKGKDAVEVEYPTAPSTAFRDYAAVIAQLLPQYRLEVGESSGKVSIDFSAHIVAIAKQMGLDPVDVEREAQQMMNDQNTVADGSRVVEGTAVRV